MTRKGQVTIPKRMRDELGLKPGSEVEFVVGHDGELVLKSKLDPFEDKRHQSRFAAIRGTANFGMTTDEIMRFLRGDPGE
ncbi:MAG TPA: AbrB/MazE/SpoVT family DNA-binding domain-containing protein [Stellaceae bacterium]|jgi:AbrB family looped-hinge helix DNA binding protein|nr:AbrB/MazE/SpoVT family DNA-binding domain-containing protein [Stellaceae bacterium]